MNKQDLIKRTSENLKIEPGEARNIINTMFDIITEELKEGNRVNLRGFGAFEKVVTTRKQRNPKTGEYSQSVIKRVTFKPAENVKAALK